jgi:MFS family permease
MNQTKEFHWKEYLSATIIVAALGYFVDIYDLILFSIVRKQSLLAIGVPISSIQEIGLVLLNIQMIGMLTGGIFWGILGDKKGRLSVLFGSILMYSLANLANGLVQTTTQYAILRFIAGFGLAGELGAGITLVSELLPKEKRGYGTMIVASIGVSGAVFAGFIGIHFQPIFDGWRICYYIGGGLGLLLLFMRVGLLESGLYDNLKEKTVIKGDFRMLFTDWIRFSKYLKCILIGLPIWYTIGILITFSPELAKAIGVVGEIMAAKAIMFFYAGVTLGDILSGAFSQWMRSRKKVILLFLIILIVTLIPFFNAKGMSAQNFYYLIVAVGFGAGFWAVIVTIAAESFGTNIRSTVTTTVPNFIRGSLFFISLLFTSIQVYLKPTIGVDQALIWSAVLTGVVSLAIPLIAVFRLEETYGKDLDYLEDVKN